MELVTTLARLTSLRPFHPLYSPSINTYDYFSVISINNRPNRGLLRQKRHFKRQTNVCLCRLLREMAAGALLAVHPQIRQMRLTLQEIIVGGSRNCVCNCSSRTATGAVSSKYNRLDFFATFSSTHTYHNHNGMRTALQIVA